MGLFSRKYKKINPEIQQESQTQPIMQTQQYPQYYPQQQYQQPIQQNIYVEKLRKFRNMLLGYVIELDEEIKKYG